MSKIAFGKPGAAAAVAVKTEVVKTVDVEPVSQQAVESVTTVGVPAVFVPNQVPAQREAPRFSDDEEDISIKDIVLPGINIPQGVGELGTVFPIGGLVLGKQLLIMDAPAKAKNDPAQVPVNILIIGFRRPRWSEKIEGGALGQIFESEQEVYDSGGTTQYAQKDSQPYFVQLDTAMVLVEMPAMVEDPTMFPYFSDDKQYALALWNLQGTANTTAARPIKSFRKLGQFRDDPKNRNDKGSYTNRFIVLSTYLKKFQNGNSAFTPGVKLGAVTSPELRAMARDFRG